MYHWFSGHDENSNNTLTLMSVHTAAGYLSLAHRKQVEAYLVHNVKTTHCGYRKTSPLFVYELNSDSNTPVTDPSLHTAHKPL